MDVRDLIRRMCRENPLWGAPRIHGELLKLGFDVSEATVSRHLVRGRKPPSRTWRTFLDNHVDCLASIDFLVVPTARFALLHMFIVLSHDRRRIVHFGVTAHPTSAWVARQIREAFPWDTVPRYPIRNRDAIYGPEVRATMKAMGIREVVTAPRSPWQNPYVEQLIGPIRCECLDYVVVLDEGHLRRILRSSASYSNGTRTHPSPYWPKIPRIAGRSKFRIMATGSSPSPRSAGSTIGMNSWPPDRRLSP